MNRESQEAIKQAVLTSLEKIFGQLEFQEEWTGLKVKEVHYVNGKGIVTFKASLSKDALKFKDFEAWQKNANDIYNAIKNDSREPNEETLKAMEEAENIKNG